MWWTITSWRHWYAIDWRNEDTPLIGVMKMALRITITRLHKVLRTDRRTDNLWSGNLGRFHYACWRLVIVQKRSIVAAIFSIYPGLPLTAVSRSGGCFWALPLPPAGSEPKLECRKKEWRLIDMYIPDKDDCSNSSSADRKKHPSGLLTTVSGQPGYIEKIAAQSIAASRRNGNPLFLSASNKLGKSALSGSF